MRGSRISRSACVLVVACVFWPASPAGAACHAFTIAVNPSTVVEGAASTVLVQRDATVNPSSVEVTSVDETAIAGRDFPPVKRTVSFTTEKMQTFEVTTTDTATHDGTRTFRLHLSSGAGCQVNPNFSYGTDARVTINDNDPAPVLPAATAVAQPRTPTPIPLRGATPVALSPTPPPTPGLVTIAPSTPPASAVVAAPSRARAGSGGNGAVMGIVIAAAVVLAGGGVAAIRLRARRR